MSRVLIEPYKRTYNGIFRNLRIPYRKSNDTFDIINLKHKDPLLLFKSWFEEAIKCEHVFEPNAMALATCNNRKGQELDSNPYASLLFYWEPLKRQASTVRVEGTVSRASEKESEEYFQNRPKSSQISATVSPQSQVIPSREFLDKKYVELESEYAEMEKLPKPSNWGGYIVFPKLIEFWQGQTNRLHDRIRFRRCDEIPETNESEFVHEGENGWVYERLAP
ncbi:Pyridoxine-5'-phosphate oxidase [Schistosoma japonicum]|nr:Pyridoxine-5'-phosphate oxidase [Schistosoma japonicum]